jgi:hypothetical protein
VSRNNSSAAATTISVLAVLGALVLFCLFFTAFLLVPFFIFIGGAIALVISERSSKTKAVKPPVLSERVPDALPEKTEVRR